MDIEKELMDCCVATYENETAIEFCDLDGRVLEKFVPTNPDGRYAGVSPTVKNFYEFAKEMREYNIATQFQGMFYRDAKLIVLFCAACCVPKSFGDPFAKFIKKTGCEPTDIHQYGNDEWSYCECRWDCN